MKHTSSQAVHTLLIAGAALLCAVCGCVNEVQYLEESRPSAYPTAGLYTPGNALGASDPTDTPNPAAGLSARCKSLPVNPHPKLSTQGTLLVEYSTQTVEGLFAPKNCGAVWIETEDGEYVATLEIAAALRRPGLAFYNEYGCPEKTGPDTVTTATLRTHTKPHSLEWSAVDLDGLLVGDGSYKLLIEVTETDKEPGDLHEFFFDKTPAGYTREIGVEGSLASLELTWEPETMPESSAHDAGN